MAATFPPPPPCPLCGGGDYVRERFFALEGRRPTKNVAILSRCVSCGLKRFLLPSGEPPVMSTTGSLNVARLRRSIKRWEKIKQFDGRWVVVVPTGTDPVRESNVITWNLWPRGEALDYLFFELSLEERVDAIEVLREARGRIKPAGTLVVAVANRSPWWSWLKGRLGSEYEPTRERLVFNRRTLRSLLERAGYQVESVSWTPVSLVALGRPANR